jgi:hypothetical protein
LIGDISPAREAGLRRIVALETRDEGKAIRKALDLANRPGLGVGGTLEREIGLKPLRAFRVATCPEHEPIE